MSDLIDPDGFRANVGIILMHRDQVFLGRRTGGRGWQFPQGGVRQGESLEQALYRELEEEIGVAKADVSLLGQTDRWLRYRLPARYVRRNQRPVCASGRSSAGSSCAWRVRTPFSTSGAPANRNSTSFAGRNTGSP